MKKIMENKIRRESHVHRRYLNAMTEEEREVFASNRPAGRQKFDNWYNQLSNEEIENYIKTMPLPEPLPPLSWIDYDG